MSVYKSELCQWLTCKRSKAYFNGSYLSECNNLYCNAYHINIEQNILCPEIKKLMPSLTFACCPLKKKYGNKNKLQILNCDL